MKKRIRAAILAAVLLACLLPAAAVTDGESYLPFSSSSSFTLKTINAAKSWTVRFIIPPI